MSRSCILGVVEKLLLYADHLETLEGTDGGIDDVDEVEPVVPLVDRRRGRSGEAQRTAPPPEHEPDDE